MILSYVQWYISKNKGFKLKGYIEPFCGSLAVINHIVDYIDPKSSANSDFGDKNDFVDLKFYAYDGSPDMILLWKSVKGNRFKKPEMNKNIWLTLKHSKPSALRAYAGFALSFGGQYFEGYAPKYDNKNSDPDAYYNDMAYRSIIKRRSNLQHIELEHRDYKNHPKMIEKGGYIIYCDPPYSKSTHIGRFGSSYQFDSEEFWTIVKKWKSWNNIVFVSEYDAPSSIAKCIWAKSMQNSIHNNHSKRYVDKLFLVI